MCALRLLSFIYIFCSCCCKFQNGCMVFRHIFKFWFLFFSITRPQVFLVTVGWWRPSPRPPVVSRDDQSEGETDRRSVGNCASEELFLSWLWVEHLDQWRGRSWVPAFPPPAGERRSGRKRESTGGRESGFLGVGWASTTAASLSLSCFVPGFAHHPHTHTHIRTLTHTDNR